MQPRTILYFYQVPQFYRIRQIIYKKAEIRMQGSKMMGIPQVENLLGKQWDGLRRRSVELCPIGFLSLLQNKASSASIFWHGC